MPADPQAAATARLKAKTPRATMTDLPPRARAEFLNGLIAKELGKS